jgi:hypothetical protein
VALASVGTAFAASSPSDYRNQAGAICRSTSSSLKKLKQPTKKSDVNSYFKAALPLFEKQLESLQKLDPPPSYRFLHGKVLSLEKQQIDGISKLIKQIDGGADPEKAFDAIDKKLGPVGDAETAAWKKLHVPACASI